MDEELTAAMLLAGPVGGHKILGCDWGTRISTADDEALCERQARQIVVLHNGPATLDLKVCENHAGRLVRETDPHRTPTGGT